MADPLGLFSAFPVTEEIRATAPELSVPLATDPTPLAGQNEVPLPATPPLPIIQKRQNRKHTTMILIPRRKVKLQQNPANMLLDRAVGHEKLTSDSRVRSTFRNQGEYVALPRREIGQRIGASAPREQVGNQTWINYRATHGDAFDRIDHLVDVGDPALEQVSDSLASAKQIHRGLDFDMRRKEKYSNLRMLGANRSGQLDALPRVGWRHPDIDDCDVGYLCAKQIDKSCRIACLTDDVVPSIG
jgi:hypothetical protein